MTESEVCGRVDAEALRAPFMKARITVLGETALTDGIGRLSEKSLHRILKYTLEPNDAFHEVKVLGSIADICNENGITEIQTRSFANLVPKLEKFLPTERVTVVYPLPNRKILHWIELSTGEISDGRVSPKRSRPHDAVKELYLIRSFFTHPNFRLLLVFLDVEEYKFRNGNGPRKTHGATRMERIPTAIDRVMTFSRPRDYLALLPQGLPEEFTAKDLQKAFGARYRYTYSLLKILTETSLICECGKLGRARVFRIVPDNTAAEI